MKAKALSDEERRFREARYCALLVEQAAITDRLISVSFSGERAALKSRMCEIIEERFQIADMLQADNAHWQPEFGSGQS